MADTIQQRVTIGDKTFMAAATGAQLAKLDERLKELVPEYISNDDGIDLGDLTEIECEVLGYGSTDDEAIMDAQEDNDRSIYNRLVDLIKAAKEHQCTQ